MKKATISWMGECLSIREWSDITGIPESTLRSRFRKKLSIPELFRINQKNQISICWNCKNAVPGSCYGCSWSRAFKPVKGWVASKTLIRSEEPVDGVLPEPIISYAVRQCPQFIHD